MYRPVGIGTRSVGLLSEFSGCFGLVIMLPRTIWSSGGKRSLDAAGNQVGMSML